MILLTSDWRFDEPTYTMSLLSVNWCSLISLIDILKVHYVFVFFFPFLSFFCTSSEIIIFDKKFLILLNVAFPSMFKRKCLRPASSLFRQVIIAQNPIQQINTQNETLVEQQRLYLTLITRVLHIPQSLSQTKRFHWILRFHFLIYPPSLAKRLVCVDVWALKQTHMHTCTHRCRFPVRWMCSCSRSAFWRAAADVRSAAEWEELK